MSRAALNNPDRKRTIEPLQLPAATRVIAPWAKGYKMGGCWILVGVEDGMWHLSISRRDRLPSWEEVRDARYELVPDEATMAVLLPPKEEYVNVHEYCLHLWQVPGER